MLIDLYRYRRTLLMEYSSNTGRVFALSTNVHGYVMTLVLWLGYANVLVGYCPWLIQQTVRKVNKQ